MSVDTTETVEDARGTISMAELCLMGMIFTSSIMAGINVSLFLLIPMEPLFVAAILLTCITWTTITFLSDRRMRAGILYSMIGFFFSVVVLTFGLIDQLWEDTFRSESPGYYEILQVRIDRAEAALP